MRGQARPAGGARGGLAAAGLGVRAAMAPLLLLLLSLLPAAAAYLCCVRRHTGSAEAVLRRREPGRAEPPSCSPPRDPVSAGREGGREGGHGRAGCSGERAQCSPLASSPQWAPRLCGTWLRLFVHVANTVSEGEGGSGSSPPPGN